MLIVTVVAEADQEAAQAGQELIHCFQRFSNRTLKHWILILWQLVNVDILVYRKRVIVNIS